MVAMDGNPTFLQFLAWKLGKAMDRSITKQHTRSEANAWLILTRVMLHFVAFSSLTFAGFLWNPIAGFVVLGISCLILSALLTTPANRPQQNQNR